MAWCCTEEEDAYVGDAPVIDSLAEVLEAVVGPTVFVELRRRMAEGDPPSAGPPERLRKW